MGTRSCSAYLVCRNAIRAIQVLKVFTYLRAGMLASELTSKELIHTREVRDWLLITCPRKKC